MSEAHRSFAARALILPFLIGATLLALGAWFACGRPRAASPSSPE